MKVRNNKIEKVDLKYANVDPDPDFSEEHNRQVIQRTIDWTDAMEARKEREYQDQLGERTSAAAKYMTDVNRGGVNTDIEKYFGKQYLTYLRGQQIMDRIKKAAQGA